MTPGCHEHLDDNAANGSDDNWSHDIPADDKQTVSFTLEVRFKGSKSDESDNIQIAVMRLSQ
jgi:hypothetical protein